MLYIPSIKGLHFQFIVPF